MLRRLFVCLLFAVAIAPLQADAEGLKGTFTAITPNVEGYFYINGNIRLSDTVTLTGIAYTETDGLTLRAGTGQRIADGFPTPLRLVLTQRSAPTRHNAFGRRIEFSHTDLDYSGRYAYIRHTRLPQEQSKDLRLIGEDIIAGDIFHLYVYEQTLTRRVTTPERERSQAPPQEQPPPDTSLAVYDVAFMLGWNPTANHKYVWETRDFGDTASPHHALVAEDGTAVEINRIACDVAEDMRFISYEGDLRDVLPRRYALKIRKVWQESNRGTVHLRVLTTDAEARVETLGDGSVLKVAKSIGSWTPEPNSRDRVSYFQTVADICANTAGIHQNAYIHLVVSETAPRAPRSPYLRKLTGTWGALKKQ